MRFHRLTMTAFGPYAATETVEFDELNEAGIFLLTGPTGAGKTSILDAICFALYGVVPGVREVKTLRSHHAAPGIAPAVELEATIGTVRYRVRRSPEWQRPKKRGDGVTRENASATLSVLEDDGTERLVSSRIAEVGHELTMAIGMSSEQFMQVVMLPQGDFQTFLHATSDERQLVLQKLFRTQRFARIEEWMKDRTRELGERASKAEKQVCQLLATVANRVGTALPDALQEDRLGDVGATARSWADRALTTAREEHAQAAEAERDAHDAMERLRGQEQLVVQLTTTLQKRAEAGRVLEELAGTEAEAADDLALLGRHDAALLVRPLLQPLEALRTSALDAARNRDTALAEVAALPQELQPATADHAGCSAAAGALRDRIAALRAVLPREAALQRAGADMQTALGARDAAREEVEELSERAAVLPAERERLQQLLDENRRVAHGLDDARTALLQAKGRHEAAQRLPGARSAHEKLVGQHLEARDRAASARERHLDVVERRLAGMAAELAGQLTEDHPCQVCGSSDHPAPARPHADAVTERDQQEAAAEADRLRTAADLLAEQVADSGRALQSMETAAAGLSPDEATELRDECSSAVASAEAAVAAATQLEERVATVEREHEQLTTRLVALREEVAALDSAIAALKTAFEEAAREVAAAVGPGGGSIEENLCTLAEALQQVDSAAAALETAHDCEERLAEAASHADAEAGQQGFASAAEAGLALLDRDTVESMRSRLQAREERRRAASATLSETAELEVDVVPDLDATRALLSGATDEWRRINGVRGSLEQRASSLGSLVDQLDAALAEWEPAREEHATAEAMTRLVRGMGGDNQLQMRLSSYVLATRLDQVLEAANERLSQMRDQRYSLRRCGKTRGGARAGLGLEVLDTWTGEARAPSTLSGGETFVVSLALALGLADVVTEESGGMRVDTLFIDEGFGMLDPETLDDVMDRIDALRAGGRTVGVVSHVTELRGRIPTQVHVERGKTGSSVAVRTLVA